LLWGRWKKHRSSSDQAGGAPPARKDEGSGSLEQIKFAEKTGTPCAGEDQLVRMRI
jgi:hypothetical protein